MTNTLKITAKGQVTLRKKVLDHLGVAPGDHVTVELTAAGSANLRPATGKSDLTRFVNSLRRPDEAGMPLEKIDEIIAGGWAGEK